MREVYRSGVPDPVNTYSPPAGFEEQDRDQSFYIRDTWTVSRLALNLSSSIQRGTLINAGFDVSF